MSDYTPKPIRLKILKGTSIEELEAKYNKFAGNYQIKASQFRFAPDGAPTMAIWYEWDASMAAYEDCKNDEKIMGDSE